MFSNREAGHQAEPKRRLRRGVVLLPSIITIGNLFCGYACVVHALRGQLESAAPFIGVAVVLDMLDGRIARMTGTSSAFGVELDSLADMVSFGVAPAVLTFVWGLSGLGKLGWAAGFIYVTATAIRLARFNIQSSAQSDKRYFIGMPSPAAAGIAASTIFLFPDPLVTYPAALAAIAVMIVPALLMVSKIKFRSFKTIDFGWQRSYVGLFVFVLFLAVLIIDTPTALVILSYGYLLSGFIGLAMARLRPRRTDPPRPAAGS
jgi:CDP-diacylglycerol--serine O-phosphatidyltransferase